MKYRNLSSTPHALVAGLLVLTLAACGPSGTANTPVTSVPVTNSPVATVEAAAPTAAVPTNAPIPTAAAPTNAPIPTAAAPTNAPVATIATIAPTEAPVATTAPTSLATPAQWTEYHDPLGHWSISYPANLLSPIGVKENLTVFISQDRSSFVGVDSYFTTSADHAALRDQATQALTAIYNHRPEKIRALDQTDVPWQAGVTFATAKGSEGTAAYTVAGPEGETWTYGSIYGYKSQGSQQLREALYQTLATLKLNPPVFEQGPNSGEGLPTQVQQPILDAAWQALKPQYPQQPLLIGLITTQGKYAAALATPLGQRPLYVYLQLQNNQWTVIEATSIPSSEVLRQKGVPDSLTLASDAYSVIDLTTSRVQDPQGGLNGYITAPRIDGDFARLVVAPADSEQRDPPTMFFKRENGTWRWLTAGTAFPEDNLTQMGVPKSLWSYGASVHGPA